MEHDVCNVLYLDRRASEAKVWTRSQAPPRAPSELLHSTDATGPLQPVSPSQEVDETISSLLAVFSRVSVHRSSPSCLSEIKSTYENRSETSCTILLIDIPSEDESSHHPPPRLVRTPSPTTADATDFSFFTKADPYGMEFLMHVSSEIQARNMSPLVLPVAVLSGPVDTRSSRGQSLNPFTSSDKVRAQRFSAKEPISKIRYYDAGAADILTSPATVERVRSLPAHAHWIKVEAKRRRSSFFHSPGQSKKTSWVGTKDDKPYTQLKEAMVAELMEHICNPDYEEASYDAIALHIDPARHNVIAGAFGDWSFSAHDFTDDELLYGVFLMLEHTLNLPELERWRINKEELLGFLTATRRVYNSSVLYHNFRHACDVTQATFYFLTQIGAIPPFPVGKRNEQDSLSPLAKLIEPFYALVLLISAIGHDVGHPGVNNGFLVTVNAPLAQLYNDRSVLESFHCAAYSQILRRYWKCVFTDRTMRKLMINAILATDMGVHRDYMTQMEVTQEKFSQDSDVDGWSDSKKDETRELLCCLLIKCADICNVARNFDVAAQWAKILIDEFYAQGQIEQDLNVPSALFGGPPDPGSLLQMCQSQIGFMTVFAYPLFGGLTGLLPAMQFTVDQIDANKSVWQGKIKSEAERAKNEAENTRGLDDKVADENESSRSDESDKIQHLPSASFHAVSSSAAGRRASGGTAGHFVGLPSGSREARRSSLGPTVVPDLSKKRSSASAEGRRRHMLRYVFCCGASPPSSREPRDHDNSMRNRNDSGRRFDVDAAKEETVTYREKVL